MMQRFILGVLLVLGTSTVLMATPGNQGGQGQQGQPVQAVEVAPTYAPGAIALLGGTALIIRGRRKKSG